MIKIKTKSKLVSEPERDLVEEIFKGRNVMIEGINSKKTKDES